MESIIRGSQVTLSIVIKQSEFKDYHIAKQNLKDVSKGGKDYPSCSFIDITIARERFIKAKNLLGGDLGKKILQQLEGET